VTASGWASDVVAAAFLTVSCVAFTAQLLTLRQLRAPGGTSRDAAVYRGLVRTLACRVGVAVLYIAVGVNALVIKFDLAVVTLAAFGFTQCIWLANSRADVRLRKRLDGEIRHGRHRR